MPPPDPEVLLLSIALTLEAGVPLSESLPLLERLGLGGAMRERLEQGLDVFAGLARLGAPPWVVRGMVQAEWAGQCDTRARELLALLRATRADREPAARALRLLAGMMRMRLALLDILGVLAQSFPADPEVERGLAAAAERLSRGETLAAALSIPPFEAPGLAELVAVGEQQGRHSEGLEAHLSLRAAGRAPGLPTLLCLLATLLDLGLPLRGAGAALERLGHDRELGDLLRLFEDDAPGALPPGLAALLRVGRATGEVQRALRDGAALLEAAG